VIDEAIRNVVCVGADPDRIALLDNFSWGDPRRPETLGRLVDAVAGCVAGAAMHGAPFVSGKDSLNNEYLTADGSRRSIPPTLVITALGLVPTAEQMVTSDLKRAGNVLVLLGARDSGAASGVRGSVLDAVLGIDGPGLVAGGDASAPARYRTLHQLIRSGLVRAAHDVSDGGLAVTLAEMAIGGRLGVRASLSGGLGALFGESSGRIIIEVASGDLDAVRQTFGDDGEAVELGEVTSDGSVRIDVDGVERVRCELAELVAAWKATSS
jgi:phosphoribosylformylglycinamidine synthase subunit PurSL